VKLGAREESERKNWSAQETESKRRGQEREKEGNMRIEGRALLKSENLQLGSKGKKYRSSLFNKEGPKKKKKKEKWLRRRLDPTLFNRKALESARKERGGYTLGSCRKTGI